MNLKSMTQPEIGALLKELGQPAFRAKQVFTWLHKGVRSYDEMTNLPKSLRDILADKYPIYAPQVVRKQESQKDGTIKYLWKLSDGNCVETVLMRYHYGNTVCISTEVGCRMGCAFCASTVMAPPIRLTSTPFTPSIAPVTFSTRAEQAAQVIPVTLNFNFMETPFQIPDFLYHFVSWTR